MLAPGFLHALFLHAIFLHAIFLHTIFLHTIFLHAIFLRTIFLHAIFPLKVRHHLTEPELPPTIPRNRDEQQQYIFYFCKV
jgi:hypothetical protein